MSFARKVLPPRMAVAEFLEWEPDDRSGALWQLRDGEPEMMAPASDRHGSIGARLGYLLTGHLDRQGRDCRVVVAPGVVPAERSHENCLVPDLGITCAPPGEARLMHEPLVLIEILSPTNVSKTRSNIRAYTTIPSVQEILVLHSTAIRAEILRRAPGEAWPNQPDVIEVGDDLRLDSIGFTVPLREVYRDTSLA